MEIKEMVLRFINLLLCHQPILHSNLLFHLFHTMPFCHTLRHLWSVSCITLESKKTIKTEQCLKTELPNDKWLAFQRDATGILFILGHRYTLYSNVQWGASGSWDLDLHRDSGISDKLTKVAAKPPYRCQDKHPRSFISLSYKAH